MKAGFQALLLVGLLLLTLLPSSLLGKYYSPSNTQDYNKVKPLFVPPGTVFAVVWPILYILQAVSVWLVLRHADTMANASDTQHAILIGLPIVFVAQLVLNYIWIPVFSKGPSDQYQSSLYVLMALVVCVVWVWVLLLKTNTLAALLWSPYLMWLLFATLMNAQVVSNSKMLL